MDSSTSSKPKPIIQSAVEIFRSNPDLEDDAILDRIVASGIERGMAIQLVTLLPLAYGRVVLSDISVVFPNTYLCLGDPSKGRLDELPLWTEALEFARNDAAPAFPIASRSPEIKVANAALRDGKKLESLVWGPPAFLWPIEPVLGLSAPAKKQPWWRRMWDEPVEYSVTHGQRTLARIAMVIAMVVGLLALAAVVYYTLAIWR